MNGFSPAVYSEAIASQADSTASTGKPRIEILDTLRGFAVLGILLLNIVSFGLPHAYVDPSVYGGSDGWNLVAFVLNSLFFEGTMRGLFSMLFGASVWLLMERDVARATAVDKADIHYRRMLGLFAFGIIHGWGFLWYGDVLFWYALAGMFLFPLRHLRPAVLIAVGVLMIATLIPRTALQLQEVQAIEQRVQAVAQLVRQGNVLNEEQKSALEKWQEIQSWAKPSQESLHEEIAAMRGNYFSVLRTLAPVIATYQSKVLYEGGFFDAFGFMLIGLAIFKLGIFSGQRSKRFYLRMIFFGIVPGVSINAWEVYAIVRSDFAIIPIMKWGFLGILYDAARLPLTLGIAAGIILIGKLNLLSKTRRVLAAVGRMALTNYMMQSALCAWIFYGFGLGLYGQLERYQLYFVVVGIWLIQLSLSLFWLKYFHYGPAEWLWRCLTYWRWQNLRRN